MESHESKTNNRKETVKIAVGATLFLIGFVLMTLGIEILAQTGSWIVEAAVIIAVLAIIWVILFNYIKLWRAQSRELRALKREGYID